MVSDGASEITHFDLDSLNTPSALLYQQALDSAQSWLHNGGYMYSTVSIDTTRTEGIGVLAQAGPKYVVGSIEIRGLTHLTHDEAQRLMGVEIGERLESAQLSSGINRLLESEQSKGFALASARIFSIIPRQIDAEHGSLDLTIDVTEGRPVIISGVELIGNELTDRDVILRQLQLGENVLYEKLSVEKIRSRLNRMGFFATVSEPAIVLMRDSSVHLSFVVTEASSSRIEGVLGYSPGRAAEESGGRAAEESGFFSGFLHLAFRNISGTARNASLAFDKESKETQQIRAAYFEPWILGYPVSIGVAFDQRQQDTSYVQLGLNAEVLLSFASDVSITGLAGYERTTPTETEGSPFIAFNSRSLTLGTRGTYDSRNDIFAAGQGILLEAEANTSAKSIYGPLRYLDSSIERRPVFAKFLLTSEGYFPLSSRLISATRIHAATLRGPENGIESSDLFRLGGFQTIRGYREKEFLTDRFVYINQEFRLTTGLHSFLFTFLDAGYLSKWSYATSNSEQGLFRLSYGVGTQFATPIGLLSASVGVPGEGSFSQAKIHFGIIEAF